MVVPQTEIVITVAGEEQARFLVEPGDYLIGRDPDCAICINTDSISRKHAQLTVNYDHALIEDLGSRSGTLVNGRPVTERLRLWPNQKIQIGGTTIELRRLKGESSPNHSVPPATAVVRRALPEEFLREKKYEIGGVVARGGMGAILEAKEACIRRTVAMKVMLDNNSPVNLMRFINEARVTGRLEHPNIIPVHELGVDENEQLFYTMKFVQGINLRKVLEMLTSGAPATLKKYPLSALLTIFQKVCDAIAFAHSRRVIHRDLKPENVMLGDFGEVLVMDWGLSKSLDAEPGDMLPAAIQAPTTVVPADSLLASMTMAGAILGTPQFMPPEQARGEIENLDFRSDIYSLGAILFQILALRPPVEGENADEVVEKVARGEATVSLTAIVGAKRLPHLPGGKVPESLDAVVMKAMAVEKAGRYQSVIELQREIAAFQNGFATSAEKASLGKQVLLLVKRHKASFGAAVAVWIVISALGLKFVWMAVWLSVFAIGVWFVWKTKRGERRALAEKTGAEKNLATLRNTGPTLLTVAESEAGFQRFDSALDKIDAALAMDPDLLTGYWQRAWVLLGLERWNDAAAALKLAHAHDPARAKLAGIIPSVEIMGAAASDAERWLSDAARTIFRQLQSAEATGPVLAFSRKLKVGAEDRRKLTEQRLLAVLGEGNFGVAVEKDGLVSVNLSGRSVRSLESLRGLPVENLDASNLLVGDVEPLHGLPMQVLNLDGTKVASLKPLRGMPLHILRIEGTRVLDLSPLSGMPLHTLHLAKTNITDLKPLAGMPLVHLDASHTPVTDGSPLAGAPIASLDLRKTRVSDISFVNGMPLRILRLDDTPVASVAALRGVPIETLSLKNTAVTDLSVLRGASLKELDLRDCQYLVDFSPVLQLSFLERLTCDLLPKSLSPLRDSPALRIIEADAYPGEAFRAPRPAAAFWKAFDAHHAAAGK